MSCSLIGKNTLTSYQEPIVLSILACMHMRCTDTARIRESLKPNIINIKATIIIYENLTLTVVHYCTMSKRRNEWKSEGEVRKREGEREGEGERKGGRRGIPL